MLLPPVLNPISRELEAAPEGIVGVAGIFGSGTLFEPVLETLVGELWVITTAVRDRVAEVRPEVGSTPTGETGNEFVANAVTEAGFDGASLPWALGRDSELGSPTGGLAGELTGLGVSETGFAVGCCCCNFTKAAVPLSRTADSSAEASVHNPAFV